MSSKSENSSALFTTSDGEPMSFFLRPGPAKSKLQPLITSKGGILCSFQRPHVILLMDPEERTPTHNTTAYRYVSTKYIYDCIEKEELLNVEDYRLNPAVASRQSPRLNNKKYGLNRVTGGRTLYTPEEDAAIFSYVSKHKGETGGNRLWQMMARQGVTTHSWQSMKHHYKVQVAKRLSVAEEQETAEKLENEETGNQETDVQKPPNEDAASAQTHSADTDLTQIDVQPEAVESTEPENAEAETSNLPQPGGACLDPQTDAEPTAAESTEPEAAAQQTTTSPQKESVPEESVQSLPNTPASESPKQKTPVEQVPPKRIYTRRKLEMSYDRKLRSSSTSAATLSSPPQPTKKTKSPERPAVEKHTTTEQPPSKKHRGENMEPVAESQQEESEEAAVTETPQTDEEPKSLPEKVEKKKEKRKLGILEMATREFEDESESAEDEAPDLQEPTDTAAVQPTSTEPMSSDAAADPAPTASNPEPGPSFQGTAQQPQALSSGHTMETGCPEPAASEGEQEASRAHLFIFDSESQEEDSQTLLSDNAAALSRPQPPISKDAAFSLTQVQLEEDVQQVKNLMNQTNQDLESVTKALLMTSGDFSAALDLLLDPSSIPRTLWSRRDDTLLLSADPIVLLHLQEKYSEEEVAKRIMFLETER